MNKPKLLMVGAGPGDPDLLTIKAQKAILSADVILHDDLVSKGIRAIFPPHCLLYDVGKRYADGKEQSERLERIVSISRDMLEQGKRVVRLKGGDPMLFSRSVEEIEALSEHGIEIEIIPGISSGIAAASTPLLPLTERSVSEGVMMVTGNTINQRVEYLKTIVQWIEIGNTVLLYMGFKRFPDLCKIMYKHGLSSNVPACAVSKVSLPEEKKVLSTIDNLVQDSANEKLQMPVIILIGQRIRNLNI